MENTKIVWVTPNFRTVVLMGVWCSRGSGAHGGLCAAAAGRPCVVGGLVALDGSRWDDGCNTCRCHNGRIVCTAVRRVMTSLFVVVLVVVVLLLVVQEMSSSQLKTQRQDGPAGRLNDTSTCQKSPCVVS